MKFKILIVFTFYQFCLGLLSHFLSLDGNFEGGLFLNVLLLIIGLFLLPYFFGENIKKLKLSELILLINTGMFIGESWRFVIWFFNENSSIRMSELYVSLFVLIIILFINFFITSLFIFIFKKYILKFYFT